MEIAIIGWGSLIWEPRNLSIRTRWRSDGPKLPIEYARISDEGRGRLTLVIHPGTSEAPVAEHETYWALSGKNNLDAAIENLREREGTPNPHNIHCILAGGQVYNGDPPMFVQKEIASWLSRHSGVEACIWTGLESNWKEVRDQEFHIADALRYAVELEKAVTHAKDAAARDRANKKLREAREYVGKTPSRIQTGLRRKLSALLDWGDIELAAELFEAGGTPIGEAVRIEVEMHGAPRAEELPAPHVPQKAPAARFEPNREVRLGLVLYGGVSLAIYINGVTREFFRASRGLDVYTLLKLLTDSDFVVDIVSGTSAGGINGIFLGYALCNNKEFSDFESLWRDLGDISRLMRDPNRDPSKCLSILDSEGYYQSKLEGAFRRLPDISVDHDHEHERVTPVKELDLFVTSTDVNGEINTVFDDCGDPIDVKSHRAVFQLKYRAGRKNDFGPEWSEDGSTADRDVLYQALAKLSRATSAFPAAFSPVHVENADPKANTVDGKLQRWGALRREAYFIDGGVLDNKPFTTTIRAIFFRPAEREVERRLLYVEPDPERFERNKHPAAPNFFSDITDALVSIPGYQSIGADLEELNQHNSKVGQYNKIAKDVWGALTEGRAVTEPVASRLTRLRDQGAAAGYVASRLVQLRDRAIEGVLKKDGRRGYFRPDQQKAAKRLVAAFDNFAIDPNETLGCFDVYYRLRRLFDLAYSMNGERQRTGVPELRAAVNYMIGVLDVIRGAMEDMVDLADFRWEQMVPAREAPRVTEVWNRVGNAFKDLLEPGLIQELCATLLARAWQGGDGRNDPATALNKRLRAHMSEVLDRVKKHEAEDGRHLGLGEWHGMLAETDAMEQEVLREAERRSRGATRPESERYARFEELDCHLFPIELVSGLEAKDIVLLTRVSPADAQRGFSCKDLPDKLAGDAFHHFGGFFKRSWRANDILWGRLDGLCQLVECVFTRKRLEDALNAGVPQRWLKDGQHPSDPTRLFAGAGQAGKELRAWLDRLFDPASRGAALEQFEKYQELLIEAAQWKILEEELPEVKKAAIKEQAEWNLFSVPAEKRDQPTGPFTPGAGTFDTTVATLAAERAAEDAIDKIKAANANAPRPINTGLGEHFRNDYHVGSEDLDHDLPRQVLLELFGRAALLARNCVFTALGDRGKKIQSSTAYTVFLDAPLRLFHAWVSWWQRSPAEFRYGQIALAAISGVMLVVGWIAREKLPYDSGGHLSLIRLGIFFLAPAAVLLVQALLFLRQRPVWRRWVQLLASVLVLIALAVLAVWSNAVYSSAEMFVKRDSLAPWLTAALAYGVPALAIVVLMALEAWVRGRSRARVASKEEVRVALRGMNRPDFEKIAKAFPVKDVKDEDRDKAINVLFNRMWGIWPSQRKERRRLEQLIRTIDRDALPSVWPGQLKFAWRVYFSPQEQAAIGKEMNATGKQMNATSDVFKKAKEEYRLAELERTMRTKHPAALE